MTRRVALVVAAILATGCADNGGPAEESGDDGPTIVTQPAVTLENGGPATNPPDQPTATVPAGTGSPGSSTAPIVGDPVVAAELVTTVDNPVDLAVRPGDPALYLVGQGGLVTRFDPTDGSQGVVLDLSDRVSARNEQGLLGLAFSPAAPLAYVNFTDRSGTTTVAEYAVNDDATFDPATEQIILTVDQPYSNHNAGDLAFGPDGMLYVPLGDGGSSGDPQRRSSDPTSLLGSLLRLDVSDDGSYTIPPDNPFADGEHDGSAGAPEVWSWGLRNPWKIAFDPVTDELWIADVGQNAFEEVNVVAPTVAGGAGFGANFGWSAFEGTERYDDDVPEPSNSITPVLTYPHSSGGCSVSGGVPYRGSAIAELEPAFVYSDYCLGTIWALDLAGGRNLVLLDGFSEVTAVAAGPAGELYVLERSGGVHRLIPG